jgi:hypothetical protein
VLPPLLQAALLAAVPLSLAWLCEHLTLMQDATLSRAIADCVGRGARLTYQMLAAAGGSVGSVTLTNAAVAHGVQDVMQSMPDALQRLGVTPNHVGAIVTAELGKLLAVNPASAPVPAAQAA